MIELHELEELCKAVNHNAINALLHNAQIARDPKATPEMKAQAEANIKAISYSKSAPLSKEPKQSKAKKVAAASEQAPQPVNTPSTQTPVVAAAPSQNKLVKPSRKTPFHEEFANTHGVDSAKFKETYNAMSPEQQQLTKDWHQQQLASKAPAAVVAPPVAPPVAPIVAKPVATAETPKVGGTTAPLRHELKVAKNADALYNLFTELKKRL